MTRRTAWGQHGFSTRFALGRTDLKCLLPGQTGRIASLTYRRPPGRNWRCQEELPPVAGVQAPGISRALQARRPIRAGSAASSAFIRDDLSALFDGDYLTSFGLDRCCEELASVTALARENDVP